MGRSDNEEVSIAARPNGVPVIDLVPEAGRHAPSLPTPEDNRPCRYATDAANAFSGSRIRLSRASVDRLRTGWPQGRMSCIGSTPTNLQAQGRTGVPDDRSGAECWEWAYRATCELQDVRTRIARDCRHP